MYIFNRIPVLYFAITISIQLIAPDVLSQPLVINEIMSSNLTGLVDEYGEQQDWIEIFNTSNQPIDINGFGLSDNQNRPLKWTFPDITMQPRDYLIVFTSRRDKYYLAPHNEEIIGHGDIWKYRTGGTEPPAEWKEVEFDDSGWQSGPSGFGYGDDDDATTTDPLISIYLRKKFQFDEQIVYALLHMDYDDAFVAYLNGTEVARSNIGAKDDPLTSYNDLADGKHEARIYRGLLPEVFYLFRVWNVRRFGTDGAFRLRRTAHRE